jgi:hypothetical protein
MLPAEVAVLDALFNDPRVAAGRYLNLISGDFVEQTDLLKDAIAWDEAPPPPATREITGVTSGDGQLTVYFSETDPGTDPITSYTVTATDYTNPAGTRIQAGPSSPITVKGLTNGDEYYITVTAANIDGTSPPSTISVITVGVPPKFVSGPAANAIVGKPYTSGFAFTGAPPPTVHRISGELPPGLTLDSNGNLTGTPTKAGSYTFTVQAYNSVGVTRATATITVSPGVPASAEITG